MTQVANRSFLNSRTILMLAIAVLVAVIIYAARRDRAPAPIAANNSAANPAISGDPITELERQTAADPDDASAWARLGAARFEMGDFAKAGLAYEKATALNPQKPALWSALGEALVMASERDPMPPKAAAAFNRAHTLDAHDPRARYFLAVKRDLAGDHKGAIADWLALLADTPKGAPWEVDLKRTIEQVGRINKIDVAQNLASQTQPASELPLVARGIPGPTALDMKAAQAMTPSQQRAMSEAMVAKLEGRLKSDPANVEGWIMLMRSRVTLDQRDKAAQALKDAIAANPANTSMLRQQAAILGLK